MKSLLSNLQRLLWVRRRPALGGFALLVVVWGGVAVNHRADVKADLKENEQANQAFAMVLEENVLRSIGEIDKALLYLRRSIETRKGSSDFATIVSTTDVLSDIIVQVAIIDAEGILRASNANPGTALNLNLSDREHYRAHLGRAEDMLFISKPVLGRVSNRWSVQFTRRFSDHEHSFAGVVVASLNPAHLTQFYQRINAGTSKAVSIVGQDGVVRSSGGSASTFTLGEDVSGSEIGARIRAGLNTTFELRSANGPQLVTLRHVSGYPLWVILSVEKGAALAASSANLRVSLATATLATLAILVVVELLFRTQARRSAAEADVAKLASEDPLTGLPNRRVFQAAIEAVARQSPGADEQGETFGVLFMDLDRFKVINDTLGHHVGDCLLQEVARRLKQQLRSADVLARLGGDEFAVVIPGVNGVAALEATARRLVETSFQPYEIGGHQIRSSLSVGIAVGPRDGRTADDLLVAADLALYAAKAGRRGTFHFYDVSMNRDAVERRQIEMDLRHALETNQLELHYQPVFDVRGGALTGFEALARWRHPTRGMIPPALFIPVAEDTGLILPLGKWALHQACREAAGWPADYKVAVNLSPVQFSDPDLVNMAKSILSETGLDPHRLELEVTERVLIEDREGALSVLRGLKQLGVRIAMDDFGTGYSSLSYLRSFPFDKIKVDRAFVTDLTKGSAHMAIVQAVVTMAQALGMTTTAEGVETPEQHRLITALGCNEVQGYLHGAPKAIADLHVRGAEPGVSLAA